MNCTIKNFFLPSLWRTFIKSDVLFLIPFKSNIFMLFSFAFCDSIDFKPRILIFFVICRMRPNNWSVDLTPLNWTTEGGPCLALPVPFCLNIFAVVDFTSLRDLTLCEPDCFFASCQFTTRNMFPSWDLYQKFRRLKLSFLV